MRSASTRADVPLSVSATCGVPNVSRTSDAASSTRCARLTAAGHTAAASDAAAIGDDTGNWRRRITG